MFKVLTNDLVKRIINGFRGRTAKTPISTDLNISPRQVSINEPRTTPMSDASAKGGRPTFNLLQKGGSVVAKGNKLARSKPTKLY